MSMRIESVRPTVCASLLTLLFLAMPLAAAGQQPSAPSSAKPDSLQTIPVRIEVMLTRLQGEKKISSLPFSLLANAADVRSSISTVSIRMGIDVPIGSTTETENRTTPTGGSGATRSTESTSTRVQYRSVGTDIDCYATRLDENRFSVRVSISDSSVYTPEGAGKGFKIEPAAFRTFSTSNTVVMRDGQTVLFGTGTDKISGETLKIEVTLHVVK